MQRIDNLIRQEFKYYVSTSVVTELRSYLKEIMEIDENADSKNSQYTITSLYFDTPNEDDFEDKVDGLKSREKFRLRIYNHEDNLVKFESKRRVETAINKTSAIIPKEEVNKILDGNYKFLLESKNDFLKMSYAKLISHGYRPKLIVEYDREAYFLPYGNIRITFDLNLRTYNSEIDLMNLTTGSIPIFEDNLQVLEVKHSIPLPSHLKFVLSKIPAARNAISKFVLGHKYIESSSYRDPVNPPF
jgi:SPX domain protein involved in polyphosphate accumulation